ncbi:MAG: glutaredoxin family protein [Alcanivorax sp.]|nr:glutaredoxin family protein [Alcanivorax sp.]
MKGCIKILLFACAMLLLGQVCAEIYTWTDAQGRVHFGDKPADNDRAQAVNVRINTFESVTYDSLGKGVPEPAARGGNVIMYATQWCGVCKKARRYFNDNNISFTEYDIDKDPKAQARFDALEGKGVPVILVGKRRMNGFSAEGFERIYR